MLDDLLSDVDLYWPDDKPYQVYEGQETRYSAWLAIKAYPGTTTGRMIDDLFRVRAEFNLFQSVEVLSRDAGIAHANDLERNTLSFSESGGEILLELQEVKERLTGGDLAMCRHGFAVEVLGDTPDVLEWNVRAVIQAVEFHGIRVKRETLNQEPLFWSTWPGLEAHNVRARMITTENLSDFVSLATLGEGLDSCSWGPMPVTRFRTESGSEYGFTFHQSPAPRDLGHTLIIGSAGSGKTTLISFLVALCQKFPKMRTVVLDRLHGMEVMCRMLGGTYADFGDGVAFNPFHLNDTDENRRFLRQMLELLAGTDTAEHRELINHAVDQAYRMPKADRCLDELRGAFGLARPGSLQERLSEWYSEGTNGGFFSSRKDSLSFDRRFVGFDMTTLLQMPKVLGPVAHYLFHRLNMAVLQDPGPFLIFIDEVMNYLNDKAMAPHILQTIREIRKLDGVAVLAAQEAESVLEHPEGDLLMRSIATLLLYPAPTADAEHYMDGFGLTETEFAWIKSPGNGRQVMLKRPLTGESAILDVDLAPLGEMLKVFDSSSTAVRELNTLRRTRSDWRNAYLDG